MIGELCVLNPSVPSPVTVVAYTSVELYAIKKEDLDQMGAAFDVGLTTQLQICMNLNNPSMGKVAYQFREKVRWQRRKESILDLVMPRKWVESKKDKGAIGTDMAKTFKTIVLRELEDEDEKKDK